MVFAIAASFMNMPIWRLLHSGIDPEAMAKFLYKKLGVSCMKILFAFKSDQKKSRDQARQLPAETSGSSCGGNMLSSKLMGFPQTTRGLTETEASTSNLLLDQLVNKIHENKNDIRFVVIYRTVKPYTWDGSRNSGQRESSKTGLK